MKLRIALFLLLGLLSTSLAFAAATVQSIKGDVSMKFNGTTSKLSANQKVESGATIQTGKDGFVLLRFDDDQMTALSGNTTFRIDKYRYNPAKPAESNIAVSILKGALRMVTGLIGKFNHSAFRLDTPVATIGIRGTDFMVGAYDNAGVDPVAVQMLVGKVTVTNQLGTTLIQPPSVVLVAGPGATAVVVPLSQLPASVSSAFQQLLATNMAAAAGVQSQTGGASGASQAASAGISQEAVTALAATAAAAVAVTSKNNNATATATATTP